MKTLLCSDRQTYALVSSNPSLRTCTGKLAKSGSIFFEKQIHPQLQEGKKKKKKAFCLAREETFEMQSEVENSACG